MNKTGVCIALAMLVFAAAARAEAQNENAQLQELQQQVDDLRQNVENLKVSAKQVKPGDANPAISAALDCIGSYSDAANNLNFTPRDVELMIQANADPFAKAYIVLNAESELEPTEKNDPFGEVSLGMEEAAIQSTALPYGLAVKGGAFFADFTRLGKVHSHDLPFTDRPPSLEQILGGEDKARGLEFSWIPPVMHYVRLTGGIVDDIGAESAVNNSLATADGESTDAFATDDNRDFDSATYYGRVATLVEIGESAVLHLGASASDGGDASTRTMGSADFKLAWKPNPAQNRLFELAGEWLTSKYDGEMAEAAMLPGGPTDASAKAMGGYVYAQYRMTPIWQPGVRFDITEPESFEAGDEGLSQVDDTLRTASVYVSAYLSEFNRLRLQVNQVESDHEIADGHDRDTQVFLQWSVMLGAHKHDFVP